MQEPDTPRSEPDPAPQPALPRAAVDELVVEYLDRLEQARDGLLEELCARDPERATALRARVAILRWMRVL